MNYGGLGAGAVTTVAGAAVTVLPNTGKGSVLTVISIASIVVGSLIFATSAARLVAKRVYKA